MYVDGKLVGQSLVTGTLKSAPTILSALATSRWWKCLSGYHLQVLSMKSAYITALYLRKRFRSVQLGAGPGRLVENG